MPAEEDQTVYAEEGLDDGESEEDDDDLDLQQNQPEDDEEEDEEEINFPSSPSISSSSEDNVNKDSSTVAGENPCTTTITVATATTTTTTTTTTATTSVAAPNGSPLEIRPTVTDSSPDHKRQRTEEVSVASEEKKPYALDDSRRLFQRLWTDEDEIGLLQGFLEYITQRGTQNSLHQHDTGPFYDQIKSRLQLDFNKNQLVEKLRRLKKKYRTVVSRISSGKDFSFKSPHDQATFEISCKIWSSIIGRGGLEEAGFENHEGNPHNNNTDNNGSNSISIGVDVNNSERKVSSSRRRSQKRPAEDSLSNYQTTSSFPNVIEDTVRSCLSPLFKELINCAIGGPCNTGGLRGLALNPLPLNFGINSLNLSSGEVVDEKWRKQQILELEVYSKRIELVQDQIKSALKELNSMASG